MLLMELFKEPFCLPRSARVMAHFFTNSHFWGTCTDKHFYIIKYSTAEASMFVITTTIDLLPIPVIPYIRYNRRSMLQPT